MRRLLPASLYIRHTRSAMAALQILTARFDEKEIEDFLTKVPVRLGQGKTEVSLDSLLPAACVSDIVKACEDFSRDN